MSVPTRLLALTLCLASGCDAPVPATPITAPPPPVAAAPAAPAGLSPLGMMSLLAFAPPPPQPPPSTRYIGLFNKKDAAPCPKSTNGWMDEPLFRHDIPMFRRFCVYQWKMGATGQMPEFPAAVSVIRLDRDPYVLVPQSPPLGGRDQRTSRPIATDATINQQLADAFQGRLSVVEAAPGAGINDVYKTPEALARTAWVAIVDTMDPVTMGSHAFNASKRRQRHGIAMAELVNDVRCPGGLTECRKRSYFVQAFPHEDTQDRAMGSLGTLAVGIENAVTRWQRDTDKKPAPRAPLVINLSLGWDADKYGNIDQGITIDSLLTNSDPAMPAPARAAYLALLYASCLDALVIAASGNNTGAPCEQDKPLAPARWERHSAPSRDQCVEWFTITKLREPRSKTAPAAPEHTPLVYAAGGIFTDTIVLPTTRPDSTPVRVLPAMQVVAGTENLRTEAWSGTSVAAAALSGLAANLWSNDPELSPHQLMALIDSSGVQLDKVPSHVVPGQGNARRISGYNAFEALRASLLPPETVPGNPYRAVSGSTSFIPEALAKRIETLETRTSANNTVKRCFDARVQCGEKKRHLTRCETRLGQIPLPVTPEPWLRPQPDSPICPDCPIKGGKLVLSLNPNMGVSPVNLSLLTLDLISPNHTLTITLPDVVVQTDVLLDLPDEVTIDGRRYLLSALLGRHYRSGVLNYFVYDTKSDAKLRMTSNITVWP